MTNTGNNVWEIDITIKQDYENTYFPGIPRYSFNIIAGSESVLIIMDIVNINDNAPIITASTANCQITVREATFS